MSLQVLWSIGRCCGGSVHAAHCLYCLTIEVFKKGSGSHKCFPEAARCVEGVPPDQMHGISSRQHALAPVCAHTKTWGQALDASGAVWVPAA